MKNIITFVALSLAFNLIGNIAQAKVKILTSIRPIHYLAEGISQDIADLQLIVERPISPHDYAPKPSDVTKIKNADLIVRIDPLFQPRLTKLLNIHAKAINIISLNEIKTIKQVETENHVEADHVEADHVEADHVEADHDAKQEDHEHHHSDYDLHLWLSPINAIKITNFLALEFSKADPNNAEKYHYNAEQQIIHLQKLDQQLQQQLKPLQGQNFFSYHDAYGHFSQQFGLNHSIAISDNLQHQISAHKMQEILQIANQKNINCVMLEPQFTDKFAKVIIKHRPNMQISTWDPLGFGLPLKANSYYVLLKKMADNLTQCFSKTTN